MQRRGCENANGAGGPYALLVREDQLRWPTLAGVFEAARAGLDPGLAVPRGAVRNPTAWRWTVPAGAPLTQRC
jgi:hypothetical protein